jgi:hypothetical protein
MTTLMLPCSFDFTGKCIRVNKELFDIFRRVNLIYFRRYVVLQAASILFRI